MKLYEAMFLFDNNTAHDWATMTGEVDRLFSRIEARPEVVVKFDDRKLAYPIRGRKRGTYVLSYFHSDPTRIGDLERDARLSEYLLRVLVLRCENMTDEKLATLKAHPPEQPLTPYSGDSRRDDRGDFGGGRGGRWERGGDRRREYGDHGGEDRGPGPAVAEADGGDEGGQ